VKFRIIEDQSPVGVVLHQAQNADLVILGMSEEWGLESHLFGWARAADCRDCPSSLLIVKKNALRRFRCDNSPAVRNREANAGWPFGESAFWIDRPC